MVLLISAATRYLSRKGVDISTAALRVALKQGQLIGDTTENGTRIFTKEALDQFITKRQAKNKPASQLKAA